MPEKKLKYLVKTSDEFPCFLWPVVMCDNLLYLPASNEKLIITSFRNIESLEKYDIVIKIDETNIILEKDSPTIFAYAFSKNEYYYASIDEFSKQMDKMLSTHAYDISKMDVFKQYELFSTIKNENQINCLLENVLRTENNQFIRNWAETKLGERQQKGINLKDRKEEIARRKRIPRAVEYYGASVANTGRINLEEQTIKHVMSKQLSIEEQIIEKVVKKSKLNKRDVESVIKDYFNALTDAVYKGERVQITGFGSFERKNGKKTNSKNPDNSNISDSVKKIVFKDKVNK